MLVNLVGTPQHGFTVAKNSGLYAAAFAGARASAVPAAALILLALAGIGSAVWLAETP
jgi:hypothetical protein